MSLNTTTTTRPLQTPKTPPTPQKQRCSLSLQASFLLCAMLVYIGVIGTQFKLMSLIGNYYDAQPHHHSPHNPHNPHNGGGGPRKLDRKGKRNSVHDFIESNQSNQSNQNIQQTRRQASDASDTSDTTDAPTASSSSSASSSSFSPPYTLPHTPHQKQHYIEFATLTAQKWNLTAPSAPQLLEQQFYKVNDYDPSKDFFHFHHLYKSGGTSMSGVIDKTVGLPRVDPKYRGRRGNVMNDKRADGGVKGGGGSPWTKVGYEYEGVLPGSYQSGNFDHDEALSAINNLLDEGIPRSQLPFRASYAHTGLRPVYGPKRTETGQFFLKQLPHRRLRAIGMLRDPTDFRASNHAMIMCGLNAEVVKFNNKRAEEGLPQICSPTEGLNISSLVDGKVRTLLEKCRLDEERERNGEKEWKGKLNQYQRKQCEEEKKGVDTLEQCRSARHLLESKKYDKHYRSMFKGLMGRFHRGQQFGGTAYGRMNYGFERAEESVGYSLQAVEEYTLQDLGGLDLTISGAGDGIGPPEPDFLWFGITERMSQSICLFYYQFRVHPLKKTPDLRVQDCRPNSWWTEEDRATVKEKEPADYAVWRAANAIMDVRLERMRMEIEARLEEGGTEEEMFYVQRGCFSEEFGSDGV